MSTPSNNKDHDRVIGTPAARNARWAAIDAKTRNAEAANDPFFQDPQHQSRVDSVLNIVKGWFPGYENLYVNQRPNRGRPFTVVKVDSPVWPRASGLSMPIRCVRWAWRSCSASRPTAISIACADKSLTCPGQRASLPGHNGRNIPHAVQRATHHHHQRRA